MIVITTRCLSFQQHISVNMRFIYTKISRPKQEMILCEVLSKVSADDSKQFWGIVCVDGKEQYLYQCHVSVTILFTFCNKMILSELILVLGTWNIWWKILSHWHMAGHTFLHNFYQFIPGIHIKPRGPIIITRHTVIHFCRQFCLQTTPATNRTAKTYKPSRYLLVPVCQGHHDVERSKKEHCVKEGIAVRHTFRLIIIYLLAVLQIHIGISTHNRSVLHPASLS